MWQKALAVLAALTLVVAAGCGGGDNKSASTSGGGGGGGGTTTKPKDKPKDKPKAGEAYDKAKGTGSVKGVVSIDGAVEPKDINVGGDAKCAAMHKDPLKSENIVAKDGKLQNVIVYVKSGWEKWSYETPTEAKLFDQSGCQYKPHVMTVMADQPIDVKNSDDLTHNVHAVPKLNAEFNLSQAKQGQVDQKKFSEPELAVKIQCDVHKWMGAYIGVFAHPFHAVTNDKGEFTIEGLPPGEYEIEAWQEENSKGDTSKLDGPHTMKVTVKDKEAATADFKFKVK